MALKNGFGKCSLFVLSANGVNRDIKHGLFVFSPKKPLIWRRRCSIGQSRLQYDVKGKYRLVSRKFWRKEVVSAEHSLNHPKATYARFYPLDKLIKSLYLRSFAVSVLFARFSFQGHAKIALMMRKHVLLSSF